jgi:hypothetical protein
MISMGNPPAEALTALGAGADNKIGVGLVVLVPDTFVIPDGKVVDIETVLKGISARHAVVYRGADTNASIVPWITRFNPGLSCGECVDEPAGFDSAKPVACNAVNVETNVANASVCNLF